VVKKLEFGLIVETGWEKVRLCIDRGLAGRVLVLIATGLCN
jgi:hypothetical protein